MFCIAAFIVFAVLALFSASYRPLAAKAWHCVIRRITFRPCDITFSEEMKGKLIGKLIFTHPRLAKFVSRWIDWLSFAFVLLSLWSLLYVANAGLNLWVYDTCDPSSAESCSLSGEACGVDQANVTVFDTLARIPDRLKTWHAEEYLGPTASFYHPLDDTKPYALEIIDPGCKFCKKLTKNMKDAGVMERMNVSYLLYPIPKVGEEGTKFPFSTLVASTIEATKHVPLIRGDTSIAPDWQLLALLFAESTDDDVDLQTKINIGMTKEDVVRTLHDLLSAIGYTANDIRRIDTLATSVEVAESLAAQRRIVEEDVRTIKIPTLLFDGRRYDRVVDVETLSR